MPIIFDSEKRMFKLDTATSSYIIEIFKENYLVHLYYGAKIPLSLIHISEPTRP